MELRYLRYFIAVAEELNFTRAAERLHTVQPSLSQQIRRLEEIVGTPLFERGHHHVRLTPAGRVYLVQARKLLDDADRAIEMARQAARAATGQLSLGFLPGLETVVVPIMLPSLYRQYPEIKIKLVNGAPSELISALESHSLDAAFLGEVPESPKFASQVVVSHVLVAVLPGDHELAKLDRIPVALLANSPIVRGSPARHPTPRRFYDEIAAAAGCQFKESIEIDGVWSAVSAVAAGVGIGLLPDFVKQILPPNVVARPLDLDPPPQMQMFVVYLADEAAPALLLFLDLLCTHFNANEPSESNGATGRS